MGNNVESSRVKNVARRALPFLSKKEIPVNPDNYRIWFEYFLGENEDIKKHLDELLESGTRFTPKVNDQLYEKFFVRDFEKESNEKIQKEIDVAQESSVRASELILNTIKDILENTEITSEYGQKLKSYTKNVGTAQTLDDIKSLLTTMVMDTHETKQANVKVQKKLEKSSEELERINLDLSEARNEARTDSLTGLFNRRHFDELMRLHLNMVKNGEKECSLIMLDIDFFKRFNDAYGHLVGDKLLKNVAKEIKNKASGNGIICRYGGEEFGIICPDLGLRKSFQLAECIRFGMQHEVEFTVKANPVSVTVSMGVCQLRLDDGIKSAIGRADSALYLAKNSGRNNVKTERDLDAEVPEN